MNKYNSTNAPVVGIMRGSCTCSVPTARAFAIGQATLQKIADGQSQSLAERLRDQLRQVWSLPGTSTLTFFPSGTDVEFMFVLLALGRAFHLAAAGDGPRVLSVVTCAGEVGSGTSKAAALQHFSELLPSGSAGAAGTSLIPANEAAGSIRSVDVKLRSSTGKLRSSDEVDAEVEALVTDALTTGTADVCVMHLVAGCKTGHVSPSKDVVQRLRDRFGNAIVPLLDACQGRLMDGAPMTYLNEGYGIMMTGSKFYCGPPFSGVALMNADVSAELRQHLCTPRLAGLLQQSALHEYLALPLVDPCFQQPLMAVIASGMDGGALRITRGTLLRWQMALMHIQEWHTIPWSHREALISSWVTSVVSTVAKLQTPAVSVLQEERTDAAMESGIFPVSSIVSLTCKLRCKGEWRDPTVDELRHAHRLMAMDLRDRDHVLKHPAEALRIFSQRCFIAQPVALGASAAPVLRVALGAAQIWEAHQALGAETGEWPNVHQDEVVFRKLALIFSDWDLWGHKEEVVPSIADLVKYDFHCWDEESHGKVTVGQFKQLLQSLGSQPMRADATDSLFRELLGDHKGEVDDLTIRYEDAIEFFIASASVLRTSF